VQDIEKWENKENITLLGPVSCICTARLNVKISAFYPHDVFKHSVLL
jgi:hypothetical protein